MGVAGRVGGKEIGHEAAGCLVTSTEDPGLYRENKAKAVLRIVLADLDVVVGCPASPYLSLQTEAATSSDAEVDRRGLLQADDAGHHMHMLTMSTNGHHLHGIVWVAADDPQNLWMQMAADLGSSAARETLWTNTDCLCREDSVGQHHEEVPHDLEVGKDQ
jgi:hypothetical protein